MSKESRPRAPKTTQKNSVGGAVGTSRWGAVGTSRWGAALAKAPRQKGCGVLQGGREKANTRGNTRERPTLSCPGCPKFIKYPAGHPAVQSRSEEPATTGSAQTPQPARDADWGQEMESRTH